MKRTERRKKTSHNKFGGREEKNKKGEIKQKKDSKNEKKTEANRGS